jgi:hypothetical protein
MLVDPVGWFEPSVALKLAIVALMSAAIFVLPFAYPGDGLLFKTVLGFWVHG